MILVRQCLHRIEHLRRVDRTAVDRGATEHQSTATTVHRLAAVDFDRLHVGAVEILVLSVYTVDR